MPRTANAQSRKQELPVAERLIDQDRPLVEQILERIESLILRGELMAGDHLSEYTLADRWGVSRAPIREACRVLQHAGILEIIRNRGVFVRKVTLEDVLHLYDIRGALWRLATREATLNMTNRHAQRLEELIAEIDEVIAASDPDAYLELNAEFHNLIISISGNAPLIRMQRDLFIQARLFRRSSLAHDQNMAERNDDHRAIVAAMRRGDLNEAGNLAESHVARSKQRFLDSLGVTTDPVHGVIDGIPGHS
jgi:DNA-binding GntR family transcriptional regulator